MKLDNDEVFQTFTSEFEFDDKEETKKCYSKSNEKISSETSSDNETYGNQLKAYLEAYKQQDNGMRSPGSSKSSLKLFK